MSKWKLYKLEDVCDFQNGFAFKSTSFTNDGEPIIRISDIQNGKIDDSDVVYFNPASYKEDLSRFRVFPNDILIAMSGGTTGKIGINTTNKTFYLNQRVGVFRERTELNHDYLYYYLITKSEESLRIAAGAAQPNLSTAQIKSFVIPVPPLSEQQRIVDILDNEITKIDALKYNAENNLQNAKDLFQSFVNEAVAGRLYNNEKYSGVSVLKRLREEKSRLEKHKLIPIKSFVAPVGDSDTLPFSIPTNWAWCKLAEVSIIQEGAGIRKFQYRDKGVQLLTVTNIIDGITSYIDEHKQCIFIDYDEYSAKYKQLTLRKGDIVCACSGGSWGKSAIYDSDTTMMLNTSTLRLRFWSDIGDNRYLYYLTKSRFFKNQLENQLSGMQPNFGYAHFSKILIPMPSLEEQKVISDLLESAYEKCITLQQNFYNTVKLCNDLKQALLRKAFNGEL